MRNAERWRPSKYVLRGGRLRGSRDPREVAVASRLVADLVAAAYEPALAEHARGRMLELGCGKAPLYGAYRDRVSAVTCVDWVHSPHGAEHVDCACDLTKPLPFPDAAFDTILLSDVLEHIPEPEALWAEAARVLAPGGRLLLNVPFLYGLHEQPHDYYRYTEFALRRFAERAGLAVLALEPVGGAPEVLADLFAKVVVGVPLAGGVLARAAQGSAALLRRTGFGRRASRRSAARFPLGYLLVATR